MYARHVAVAEEAHRREGPPPAHSHHAGRPQTDKLHQLANVAAEQREQQLLRPHSEPREKSPALFHHADRAQMTPPAPRPPASPYSQQQALSASGQRHPVAPGPRQPIGQPPPLINIKSPKLPGKSEKMSSAGGSITAGTPVQPLSGGQPPVVRYEGSISSGTPRYDPQSRHPPGEGRAPQAPSGSITRGTPVSYDAQQQQQVAAERRTPVSSHEGAAQKMSQAAMLDAATREAVARNVMYHERLPLHVYNRATLEQMYQMGPRRLSPTGTLFIFLFLVVFEHMEFENI